MHSDDENAESHCHGSSARELVTLTPASYTAQERVERLRRENRLLRQEVLRQHRSLSARAAAEAAAPTEARKSPPPAAGTDASQTEALLRRVQTLERKNAREVARRTAAEREYRYEIELLRLALDEAAVASARGVGMSGMGGMSRPGSPQTVFPPSGFHGRTASDAASSPSQRRETAADGGRATPTALPEDDSPAARLQKLFETRIAEHEQANNPWATNADALSQQAANRREQRRMRLRGITSAEADGDDENTGSPLPRASANARGRLAGVGGSTMGSLTTGGSSLVVDETDDADTPVRRADDLQASIVVPGTERFQVEPIRLTPGVNSLRPSRRPSQLAASAGGTAGQAHDDDGAARYDNAHITSGRRGRPRRTTLAETEAEVELATGMPVQPVVNPNQIGVELKDDERTRSWYLKEALCAVLLQVVHSRSNVPATTTTVVTPPPPPAPVAQKTGHSPSDSESDSDVYADYGQGRTRERHSQSGVEGTSADTTAAPAPKMATDTVHTDDRGRVLVYKDVNPAALQRAIADSLHFHVHCAENNPVLCRPHEARTLHLGAFASENSDPTLRAAFSPEHMSEEVKEVQRAGEERKKSKDSTKGQGHGGEFRDDELEVTVHAPIIFTQVRSFVGLDVDRFRVSLTQSTWRQSMSPGKSGTTLMYFGDCVMKTMKDSEFEFLMQRYLPLYVPYCERYPHSLLPQFYGVISVQWLKLGVTRRFFLMQNVFSTQYYIHRIYDVKGSTVNRTALKPGQPAPRTPFGALMLKDNDLPPQLIICGPHQRAILVAQLRSDVHFLQSLNIVDYSCMIGVRSRIFSREEGPSRTVLLRRRQGADGQSVDVGATVANGELALHDTGSAATAGATNALASLDDDVFVCIRGCDGGLLSMPIYSPGDDTTAREDVYYIGIIDVLQEYNRTKKLENFAKGFVNDRKQISVIPPKEYAERLCRVIERISA